jgi:hypothetical protein
LLQLVQWFQLRLLRQLLVRCRRGPRPPCRCAGPGACSCPRHPPAAAGHPVRSGRLEEPGHEAVVRGQPRELGPAAAGCSVDEFAHGGLAERLVTNPVRCEVARLGEEAERLQVAPYLYGGRGRAQPMTRLPERRYSAPCRRYGLGQA